MNRTTGLGAGQ